VGDVLSFLETYVGGPSSSAMKLTKRQQITPDFVFCRGPFLHGDYQVGETLLKHSASAMHFCDTLSSDLGKAPARRLVLVMLGIKPDRAGLWASSRRPGESAIKYILLSGVPAIVLPAEPGAPLLSWHAKTLKDLWKLSLPADAATAVAHGQKLAEQRSQDDVVVRSFAGTLATLTEYVGMVVDWSRVTVPDMPSTNDEGTKRLAVNKALAFFLAAAVRSGESKKATDKINPERAGIALWRVL
jgi:hypothetical protein